MNKCPTRFLKKKNHMPKKVMQNKHVTKESGNECEQVGITSGKVGHDKRTRGSWQVRSSGSNKAWKIR
jgi:hypothetical protein